jgi:hypothetical protein
MTPDLGPHLRFRLGQEACDELSGAFAEVQIDMITITTERFDGRLVAVAAELRQEIAVGDASLRVALAEGLSNIRTEMGALRADVLRWAFAFWATQLTAMAALVALMLRWH